MSHGRRLRLVAGVVVVLAVFMVGRAVAGTQDPRSGSLTVSRGVSASSATVGQVRDGTASVTFSVPALPTGGGLYLGLDVRDQAGRAAYRGKVRILPDGALRVGAGKIVAGVEQAFGSAPVPGRLNAGGRLRVDVRVSGGAHARVATRAWVPGMSGMSGTVGAVVPQWQYQTFDGAAPAIPGPGGVRAWAYLSGSAARPVTVSFQGLHARPDQAPGDPAPTTSTAPQPSPTQTHGPTTGGPIGPSSPPPPLDVPGSAPGGRSPTVPSDRPVTGPPSPSPSLSPSLSPLPGEGGPSAATTGVPAGTKLTVHNGDLTITKPGTVIDALDIRGFVEIRAKNVTVRRSLIRGGAATGLRGVVQNNAPTATGFVLEDSEVRPAHPSVWLTGVKGANFTMRRVHVNGGVVDGVMVSGNQVRVESSYIHGLVSYADDPTHADGSHNDGVQVVGGSDITVTGNTILAAPGQNSVLQVTQDVGPTRRLTFSRNRVDGGTCSVKLTHQGGTSLGPVVVSGNRFGDGMSIPGCAILRTGATSLAESGNVWLDGGLPVAVKTYG